MLQYWQSDSCSQIRVSRDLPEQAFIAGSPPLLSDTPTTGLGGIDG
jgi:hypothetical protein